MVTGRKNSRDSLTLILRHLQPSLSKESECGKRVDVSKLLLASADFVSFWSFITNLDKCNPSLSVLNGHELVFQMLTILAQPPHSLTDGIWRFFRLTNFDSLLDNFLCIESLALSSFNQTFVSHAKIYICFNDY